MSQCPECIASDQCINACIRLTLDRLNEIVAGLSVSDKVEWRQRNALHWPNSYKPFQPRRD
jgi:hypothetical protein